VHPIAFHLGSLTVHWYGVMIALAFLAGLWTATRAPGAKTFPAKKSPM
jgi:phosphatidylglycerol---prolipoprotein diacylglyceryl transferase